MTDQVTEPATGVEEPVVLEDSEEDQERMRELDERIRAQGGIEGEEPEAAARGGGSPQAMIAEAKKHLGYHETGENDTKFNRWLGKIGGYPHDGFGYPWCHAFISYCLGHSGNAAAGPRTAGCAQGAGWFKQRGRFSQTPHAGDIVYYGANGGTHVELVVGVSGNNIQTIGGNTSGAGAGAAFFNGDAVCQKTVARSSRIHGFGHPQYGSGAAAPGGGGATAGTPMTAVRSIRKQQEAVNALGHAPKLDVDGEWGPRTEAGVKWLQKKIGAEADGQWGKETERLFAAFRK